MKKKMTFREFLTYTGNLEAFIVNYNIHNGPYKRSIAVDTYIDDKEIYGSNHISAFTWSLTSEGGYHWEKLYNSFNDYIYEVKPLHNNKY